MLAQNTLYLQRVHKRWYDLATEELGEFAQAVNDRNPELAKKEALDLIAVMIRYLQEEK